MTEIKPVLPDDAAARNDILLADALLDYFPLALAEVARVSAQGSKQHHPDTGIWWDRTKSTDHANKLFRHLVDRGTADTDGMRHSAKVAWRALALLQQELEDAGGKPGRASRWPDREPPKGAFVAGDVRYVANIKTGPMAPAEPAHRRQGIYADGPVGQR